MFLFKKGSRNAMNNERDEPSFRYRVTATGFQCDVSEVKTSEDKRSPRLYPSTQEFCRLSHHWCGSRLDPSRAPWASLRVDKIRQYRQS